MENIIVKFIEKNKKKINILGEFVSYFYIISLFLDSKLNMKIGYILLGLGVLKIIFFKDEIKKINKKVYGMFLVIFIIGIITNFFASKTDGINTFINENSKFLYSMLLPLFLEKKERIDYIINIGIIIFCIGIFWNKNFILDGNCE